MSIYGMMFRKCSHVSTKFAQMTYVKSLDLIKPPRNSSKNTSSKFRPPYAWRSKKCKSLKSLKRSPQRSRGVPRRVPHGSRWHWGRGCRPRRRRRTFHRPRRSIPMCGHSALWAPFRSETADSSDWPAKSRRDVLKLQARHWLEMVAQKPITILGLEKWSWPLGRNLPRCWFFRFPHLPLVVKMGYGLRCNHNHKKVKTC